MNDTAFWSLIAVGIIAGALLLIATVGLAMPRSHQVMRAIVLKQPPEVIWQTITDFAAVRAWQGNVVLVEKQPDKNGHEVWKETYAGDYGLILETIEATPPTRLVRSIIDEKGPFRGRWEFSLQSVDGACKISITEFGEVPNPFFRVMFRLFMKPEAYLELYLQALAKKYGEQAAFV